MSAIALAARSGSTVASAIAPNIRLASKNPSGRLRTILFICTCCCPSAGSRLVRVYQTGLRHYLTQAGSKAKPNGVMLTACFGALSDETILKGLRKATKIRQDKKPAERIGDYHDRVHRWLGAQPVRQTRRRKRREPDRAGRRR